MPFPFFKSQPITDIEKAKKMAQQGDYIEATKLLASIHTPEAEKLLKEIQKKFTKHLRDDVQQAKKKAGVRGNVRVTGTGFKRTKRDK
jgi:predicted metal-dependent hydrolase